MKHLHFSVRALIILAIFVILLSLTLPHLLRILGYFMVFEQEPQKADVIIVLNGRDIERSLAAVDLYKQGYSNYIVMARGFMQPGSDELWKRVNSNFDSKIFFQRAIQAMGVPESAFMLIGHGVTSTYDEAIVSKQFLKENGYKSIILVTSKWHSKRAYLTFRSILKNDGIRIFVKPSKYDAFNPDAWWKNSHDTELFFYEYFRIILYALSFRISIQDIFA